MPAPPALPAPPGARPPPAPPLPPAAAAPPPPAAVRHCPNCDAVLTGPFCAACGQAYEEATALSTRLEKRMSFRRSNLSATNWR